MAEDRNALLGVLAVRKGWAQPAEVLAAQMALNVNPGRTLAGQLAASGSLTRDQESVLEAMADKALKDAGGNVQKAIAANGGLGVLSPPPVGGDPFIDDEATVARPAPKGQSFGDDDDEPTSIKLDLTPAPEKKPASLDEEDEPTKVLDWDRATRKSVEQPPPPPRKK